MRVPVVNLGALGQPREPAPLPTPSGALYRKPNPDGSRKRCGDCMMWVREKRCLIHEKSLEVTDDLVCGFNVFGAPLDKWMEHPGGRMPVTPEESGLRPAGPGVACASCRFYQDQGGGKGLCFGVSKESDRRPPQPVDLLGWCARYESV